MTKKEFHLQLANGTHKAMRSVCKPSSVLNGHLSPGGGFSGGAIIGAGLILYVNAFGFEKASKIMNRKNYAVIS